jgi:hypothetical protein
VSGWGDIPRPLTMASLPAGTRVRHIAWGDTGTIRVSGSVTEIRWDEHFGEIGVSPEGPVRPEDLEILGEGKGDGSS